MVSSKEIKARHDRVMFPSTANYYRDAVALKEGKGSRVVDWDGTSYLDFFGGILTVSVGHANERVNARIKQQVDRLTHVSTLYPALPMVELAEKLVSIAPGKLEKAFFTASGTEADETAVALAQAHSGRTELIALRHGYSGRSIMAQALTAHSTYRGHRQALVGALRSGCNLIDTSTNYMDGDSERLVGSVLAELIKPGELRREEVIVVSKVGYVQGQNLKRAEAREKTGKPYPEMVKYGEGIWHCLHPEFLADQLDLSLDRLGLQTLDVLLLHNAEYFLSDAAHHGKKDIPAVRKEFYRRLQAAFEYLERQVAAGRLLYYGVSSNTSTAEPDDPEAVSLSKMLEAAQSAASAVKSRECHFRALQCPMNLFESGAVLIPNTSLGEKQTLLEFAQAERIAVLANRPLNAMPSKHGGMIRLAEIQLEETGVTFEAQRDVVAELEADYRLEIAPQIQWSGQGMSPQDYFRWAEELARLRPRVQSFEHWDQIEDQMIAPQLSQVIHALTKHFSSTHTEQWQQWQTRYLPQLLLLLKEMRREAGLKSREQTAAISKTLESFLPIAKLGEPISRKALWVLASTPGVTCVLNGMRTPAYVADSMGVLAWVPLSDVRRVYEAMRTTR